jgi:hypothetical protein
MGEHHGTSSKISYSPKGKEPKHIENYEAHLHPTVTTTLRVFENRVLRRIFGQKKDGVTEEWRKLRNKELHNLYSSPSIIRIIKSWRMRWVGHVA